MANDHDFIEGNSWLLLHSFLWRLKQRGRRKNPNLPRIWSMGSGAPLHSNGINPRHHMLTQKHGYLVVTTILVREQRVPKSRNHPVPICCHWFSITLYIKSMTTNMDWMDQCAPALKAVTGTRLGFSFFLEMGCPRPLHQLMHTAVLLRKEQHL
jgi:hypothetical protein